MNTVKFAEDVFNMFNAHKELLKERYKHIQLPAQAEVRQWLSGAEMPKVGADKDYDRGRQFVQLASAIGANVVDRGKASPATYATYKALWAIKIKSPCAVCGCDTKSTLMFKNDTCRKARCQLQHMRECM